MEIWKKLWVGGFFWTQCSVGFLFIEPPRPCHDCIMWLRVINCRHYYYYYYYMTTHISSKFTNGWRQNDNHRTKRKTPTPCARFHRPRVRLNERWISSKTWCVSLDLNVTMSWAWCCWSRSTRMTFNLTSAWMSPNDTSSNSDDRSTVCSRAE